MDISEVYTDKEMRDKFHKHLYDKFTVFNNEGTGYYLLEAIELLGVYEDAFRFWVTQTEGFKETRLGNWER